MLETLAAWFTALMIGFLAFTQNAASTIEDALNRTNTTPEDTVSRTEPTPLPSRYDAHSIPDILLQDPQYQRAGVIESDPVRRAYTTDPAAALVNIFCTHTNNQSVRTTTGSGFFIEPRGVILTNAHVAQFLLLETLDGYGEIDCLIRTGNPASDRYRAELLYLPPSWIQEYAAAIVDERPVGTGERDYALLYVSESRTSEPLPAFFPALDFDTSLLPVHIKGSEVTAAGYPAAHLFTEGTLAQLIPRVTSTSITDLFTFGSNYADVMALSGSVVGEHGSSGGPILNADGTVIGLITTRGDDARDGMGSLRAITLSYIDRTISQETGFNLRQSTQGELAFRSHIFQQTLAPFLTALIARELQPAR